MKIKQKTCLFSSEHKHTSSHRVSRWIRFILYTQIHQRALLFYSVFMWKNALHSVWQITRREWHNLPAWSPWRSSISRELLSHQKYINFCERSASRFISTLCVHHRHYFYGMKSCWMLYNIYFGLWIKPEGKEQQKNIIESRSKAIKSLFIWKAVWRESSKNRFWGSIWNEIEVVLIVCLFLYRLVLGLKTE